MDRYVEEKSYYIYEVSVSGGSFKACFIDYAKAFDCVDHNKVWKILKEMGIPDHLTWSCKICKQIRKPQLELDMKQQTCSK